MIFYHSGCWYDQRRVGTRFRQFGTTFVSIQRLWDIACVRCGRSTARDLREYVTSVWDVVHWPTHEIVWELLFTCVVLSHVCSSSCRCHAMWNAMKHNTMHMHNMSWDVSCHGHVMLMLCLCHALSCHVFHVNARHRCSYQPVQVGERDLDL